MLKTRVAVLRGGPSDGYTRSLQTGSEVLKHMPPQYAGIDILIDKAGIWHEQGVPSTPEKILRKTDVVWNALHDDYGEDGTVQKILQAFGTPAVGAAPLAAALSFNPLLARKAFKAHGLRSPYAALIEDDGSPVHEKAHSLFRTTPLPVRITTEDGKASFTASTIFELESALAEVFARGGRAIVEEDIRGKHAGCAIIEDYRGQKYYALLPAHLHERGMTHAGVFTTSEKLALEMAAIAAHTALGMRHYSKSYFILHPTRGAYLIRTRAVPELHAGSHFRESLEAVGMTLSHFLDHAISLARKRV